MHALCSDRPASAVPLHAHTILQFIFPNAMGHPVTALLKTFLDQAIMAPAGIGLFFTAMGVLEGKSTSQVRRGAKPLVRGCGRPLAG